METQKELSKNKPTKQLLGDGLLVFGVKPAI